MFGNRTRNIGDLLCACLLAWDSVAAHMTNKYALLMPFWLSTALSESRRASKGGER